MHSKPAGFLLNMKEKISSGVNICLSSIFCPYDSYQFWDQDEKKNDQLNEIREPKAKLMLTTYLNPDLCVVREI